MYVLMVASACGVAFSFQSERRIASLNYGKCILLLLLLIIISISILFPNLLDPSLSLTHVFLAVILSIQCVIR